MRYILTGLCLFLLSGMQGQQQPLRCAFDHWMEAQRNFHRPYADAMQRVLATRGSGRSDNGVLTLPVVVHVVYHTDAQNIPDSVILSQLVVLNEDFRRLNANAGETRHIFLPVAADCEIEFTLASSDPGGNPTSGITRTYTEREGFELDLFAAENTLDEVKRSSDGGADGWDPERYINVWICNIEAGFLGQVFGLAYPPADLSNWPDGAAAPDPSLEGVVVHYTTVGRNNPASGADDFEGNDLGRTLVHEMGHYLGLRHTWGDAIPFLQDGCTVDDGIEDTPNTAAGDQFQCNLESNSCEADEPGDLPDMVENFLDYSPDACMNLFTQGQKDLMRYVIETLRPGLLDGTGLGTFGLPRPEVFPNPASDVLHIRFARRDPGEVILTDGMGRRVISLPAAGQSLTLDASPLPSAVYVLYIPGHRPERIVIR